MKFKGTPGPWTITDSGGSIMDSDQFIIATCSRLAVLCRWHEKGFEHFSDEGASKDIGTIAAKANANLIAAAPGMLGFLLEIKGAYYLSDKHQSELNSIIKKALGRE
ncbi:Uncharacterised protein [Morganella morganii]|uniref:hypothetical protein n=1 Tax=Morganella morganii TaxID=582 RepID=UPI000786CC47|nr:hypothetical protein [Morganella morganii]QXO40110.1 hypothetical protein JL661_05130 [Morganella morganii]WQD68577.1 hypothetical protein U0006_05140 [Morganella morganii]VDY33465.1 Uncharacterised protein [Morganella morganii]